MLEGNVKTLYRPFNNPSRIMQNVRGNAGLMHAENDQVLPFKGALDLSSQTGIPILEKDLDGGHFIGLSPDKLADKGLKALRHIQGLLKKC